jgi:hypothetical protein
MGSMAFCTPLWLDDTYFVDGIMDSSAIIDINGYVPIGGAIRSGRR